MVSSESRRRTLLERLLRRSPSPRPGAHRSNSPALGRAYSPIDEPPADGLPSGEVLTDPQSLPPDPPLLLRPEGPGAIRGIASGTCPKCHVPFLPAGSTGRWGCPFCGRHATTVGAPASVSSGSSRSRADRPGEQRHEELLAAWMIGAPLPCPHCRATLRHTSGGEFACPACGERTVLDELASGPSGAGVTPSVRSSPTPGGPGT